MTCGSREEDIIVKTLQTDGQTNMDGQTGNLKLRERQRGQREKMVNARLHGESNRKKKYGTKQPEEVYSSVKKTEKQVYKKKKIE